MTEILLQGPGVSSLVGSAGEACACAPGTPSWLRRQPAQSAWQGATCLGDAGARLAQNVRQHLEMGPSYSGRTSLLGRPALGEEISW
jgi:hypothetical protein